MALRDKIALLVNRERGMALVAELAEAMRQHVSDRAALTAIRVDLGRLLKIDLDAASAVPDGSSRAKPAQEPSLAGEFSREP